MFVRLLKTWQGQQPGAQLDVSEGVAKGMITDCIAEEVKGDPLQGLFAKAAEGFLANVNKAMSDSVDAALKQFVSAAGKSRKNAVPAIFGDGEKGDPKKTFGSFLIAVRNRDEKALEEMGSKFVAWDQGVQKAALTTNTGATGGYLLPTEFYQRIMMLVTERSIVRPRAMVIPMSVRECEIPMLDHVTAPTAGDTAMLGGIVARWTEENADKNQTEPTFRQAALRNYELSGYSKLANSLIQDAPGLEGLLFALFSQAIAWYEDYNFIRGNGVGKPLGAQTWGGVISVSRSAASAFALADFAKMVARWLGSWNPMTCCWTIHPTVLEKLFQMESTGGGHSVFLSQPFAGPGTAVTRPIMMLGGLPIETSEKVPALNTAGDIFLADWSMYVIGDRQQVEIAFSEHAGFTTNQTFWRFVSRIGGMPWMRDKVTLADASSTLSPFITLAAA